MKHMNTSRSKGKKRSSKKESSSLNKLMKQYGRGMARVITQQRSLSTGRG